MYRESDFRQYIRLKGSNKVFHAKRISNDITNFPNRVHLSSYFYTISHEVWYKDYLVDIIVPSYYFQPNGETKIVADDIGEVKIDDNPIIVLMKLKDNI